MTFEFEAIGTHWKIQIEDEISDSVESDIFNSVRDRIAVYDQHYSRFRSDSLVTEMSKQIGTYTLPDDAKPLFDLYERLYRLTNGSVTPLIGRLLEETGYDAQYSLETKPLHVPPTWNDAIEYDFPNIEIKQSVLIDVGAAGKGYLVDLVAGVLHAKGVRSFSINAGGDILHQSATPHPVPLPRRERENARTIRVGLEHPDDTSLAIGVAEIRNESICGSAGNRRTWGEFHHILDPHTLKSPRHIKAVWVIAKTALLADALTTCLFFVEPEPLQMEFNFEYVILYADNSVKQSDKFRGELFFV